MEKIPTIEELQEDIAKLKSMFFMSSITKEIADAIARQIHLDEKLIQKILDEEDGL